MFIRTLWKNLILKIQLTRMNIFLMSIQMSDGFVKMIRHINGWQHLLQDITEEDNVRYVVVYMSSKG